MALKRHMWHIDLTLITMNRLGYQLTAILLRHVVPETILASEFPEEITEVNTVGGETITLDPNEATVESSAGKAKVIKTDILASNGVVHIVDTVF